MSTLIKFAKILGDLWCRTMHQSPMWPIHGQYQCRRCMRCFSVPWGAGCPSEAVSDKASMF